MPGQPNSPVIIPRLPLAPGEYSKEHMDLLVQALDNAFDIINGFGTVTAGSIFVEGLPDGSNDLSVGEVYVQDGFLRVVRIQDTFVTTVVAASALGTVTVTTT